MSNPVIDVAGFCPSCNQDSRFISYNNWLRDGLVCSNCNSIPRERALMVVIDILVLFILLGLILGLRLVGLCIQAQ